MAQIGPVITLGSSGPGGVREIGYSNFFVVGQTPWGPDNTWTTHTSFQSWLRTYGGLNKLATVASGTTADTYTVEVIAAVVQCYYAVKAYFDEKGSNAPGVLYFCRAIATSGGPTAGLRTYNDGGANNTTITAKSKGIHGNATFITITNPSPTGGTGYAQVIAENARSGVLETWELGSTEDAANISKKSELITVTLPAGLQLPITAARGKLNAGTPGTADAYAATAADLVGTTTAAGVKTGLQVFNDQKMGTGFVAIPGNYSSTVRSGINVHCSAYYRLGLLGAPSGLNLTTVVSDLSTTNGPDLEYCWPQVYVASQSSTQGGQILVDNVGHKAGLYARCDGLFNGPQKSAAGIMYPLRSALDVERASGTLMELCDDDGSKLLADSLINTIRIKGNPGGVVSWGMRTLSQDNRYRQAPVRRILQLIYLVSFFTMEGYTFEPIDPFGRLFAKLKGDLDVFLSSLRRNGTLYGTDPGVDARPTDAYFVTCNSSNNPGTAIANGELHVDVAFVPTYNAEKITENLILTTPGFIGRAQS